MVHELLAEYFEKVAVKTNGGRLLSGLTLERIRLDLEAVLLSERTGIPMSESGVNIRRFISLELAKVKDGDKIDIKKALNLLEKEMLAWNERPKTNVAGEVMLTEQEQTEIYNALHHVFDAQGVNVMPISELLVYARVQLKVPFAEGEKWNSKFRQYLAMENNEKKAGKNHYFEFYGKAFGQVYRVRNGKNKPTNVQLPVEVSGGKKGGVHNPKYPQYRWTKAFVDAGITSRAQFDRLIEWNSLKKPTVDLVSRFLKDDPKNLAAKRDEEE